MVQVKTKNVNEKWLCFATIKNYDYHFEGESQKEAQDKMKIKLKENGITNANWSNPVILPKVKIIKKSSFRLPKIDNL